MDFTLSPEFEDIRVRTRAFIAEHVLPLEGDRANYDPHENIRLDILAPVQAKAKAAGLWSPQAPQEYGGMGLPIVGWAAMYEEANRSIFGPVALNCSAPDDGNMNLLAKVGTAAQKDKWLRPIVEGKVRSSFAMTEPAPGSGSDPGMMRTRAEVRNDRYIIRGRKWFITGAGEASHFILIARTSDDPRRGLTAFLFHKDQPAGASCVVFRSWGPRSTGATASLNSTDWRFPPRTC
jgi:acyl-CoA dehydrogenase